MSLPATGLQWILSSAARDGCKLHRSGSVGLRSVGLRFRVDLPYDPDDELALGFGESRSLRGVTMERLRRFVHEWGRPVARPVLLALLVLLQAGCFAPVKSAPVRSSVDQQVTTSAVRAAVAAFDLGALETGALYAVRVDAPAGADADWIRGALEARLLAQGFHVTGEAEEATHRLVALVPYAGSDLERTLIGIPLLVPGLPASLGDLSVYKSSTLTGRAALRLQVRDAGGRLVTRVPTSRASRYVQNLTFLTFIGAFLRTDVEDFVSPGSEE